MLPKPSPYFSFSFADQSSIHFSSMIVRDFFLFTSLHVPFFSFFFTPPSVRFLFFVQCRSHFFYHPGFVDFVFFRGPYILTVCLPWAIHFNLFFCRGPYILTFFLFFKNSTTLSRHARACGPHSLVPSARHCGPKRPSLRACGPDPVIAGDPLPPLRLSRCREPLDCGRLASGEAPRD